MDITYLGETSFGIKTKLASVVLDPQGTKNDFDIAVFTSDLGESKIFELENKFKKVFAGPGEYEAMGVSFIGISSKTKESNKNTIYVIEVEGLRLCFLGKINQKLSDGQASAIGDIDILITPSSDISYIQQIEPYFIIPWFTKEGDNLEKFLKECGLSVEKTNKFTVKKEEIMPDQTAKVVVLEEK